MKESKFREEFKFEDLFNSEVSTELANRIVECRDTHTFLNFQEAKEFIWTLHLQSKCEYRAWHLRNKIVFLPIDPEVHYKKYVV